jgi:hypothetical protein
MPKTYGVPAFPVTGVELVQLNAPVGRATTAQIAALAGGSAAPLPSLNVTGGATIGGALQVAGPVTLSGSVILLFNLQTSPTSPTVLPVGALWNNNGVICVVQP